METSKITYDLEPLFDSLLRDHNLRLGVSYYGVLVVDERGKVLYEDGEFRPMPYTGPDSQDVIKRRVMTLFKWILVNAWTPECDAFLEYLNGKPTQYKQLH